jgi:predicted nuclease of restriction endonuclease-like (RecB) superfamily
MMTFQIRQLPTDELQPEDAEAFLRVGFTHHMAVLFKCDSTDERWYYIRKCASEFWSVDSLKYHISANDYMKYGAMPSNFKLTIPNEKQASRAVYSFKDEYLLDFINVDEETDPELIDEPELHAHVVDNIRKFILAFGNGFCFIGSKYRVIVDEDEYFIDLLFFHRALDCLVAIELKSGEFKPSYLGQLNFYLSALDEYVKMPDENPSVGIILCKKAKKTTVEFAVRDFNKPMGVATYRLGGKIPEPYDSLIPVIDGVQEILLNSTEPKERESE